MSRPTRWQRLVRWYEARHPLSMLRLREIPLFWRVAWWLCTHGFIVMPTGGGRGPGEFRNWLWQWAYWRGPYSARGMTVRPTFEDSVRETLWLVGLLRNQPDPLGRPEIVEGYRRHAHSIRWHYYDHQPPVTP